LKSQFKYFEPVDSTGDVAKASINQQFQVKGSEYVIKDSYLSKSTVVTHMYLKQLFQGVDVANGDTSVNVDAKGTAIAYGDSFYHNIDVSKRML
jgi:extracellular elastinolytic metalloproteinase